MYIGLSLAVLVLSYYLFLKASGSMALSKLNMISYTFYVPLVLQSFIGSLLIILEIDNDPIINMLVKDCPYDIRFYGWVSVLYTMIAMPIGMLVANKMFNVNSVKVLLDEYVKSPIINLTGDHDGFTRLPLYFLSVVSIGTVVYTYLNLKHIPWLSLFSGSDAMGLALLREEAGTQFGGNQLVRQIFGNMMTPILAYIAYSYWKMSRKGKDRAWFYIMLVASFFILTHSLAKSPFVMFLLGFLFLTSLIKGRIKTATLLLIPGICLSILVLIYFYIMGFTSSTSLFLTPSSGLLWRIVVTQIVGLYGSFAVFPYNLPHMDFISTSHILSTFFGVDYLEPSAKIVMRFINPIGVEEGMSGYANSLYIAEAWAHYGIAGVLLSPLYVGFIMQSSYLMLLRRKKSPIYLALFAYLSYRWGVTTSFFYFVFNPDLVIIIFIMIIVISVSYTYYNRNLSHVNC